MQIDENRSPDDGDFDSVFSRDENVLDSHDSEADTVASEAQAQPRDENGRFTSVHNEPVAEPAAEPPPQQAEAQPQPSQPETPDPSQSRMVPLPELLGERQKRQDMERQLAELNGQLQAFQQMYQQPQQQQFQQHQPQQVAPDPYTEPEAYFQHQASQLQAQFERQLMIQAANTSEMLARQQYGDEMVTKAQQWALANNAGEYFLRQNNPYGTLMQAYRQHETMQKVGPDVEAYEKKVEERVRAQVLQELKQGNPGQPKPTFPGTLAAGTPTGRQGGFLDPQTAADSIFARREG